MNMKFIVIVLLAFLAGGSSIYFYQNMQEQKAATPEQEGAKVASNQEEPVHPTPEQSATPEPPNQYQLPEPDQETVKALEIDYEAIPDVIAEINGAPVKKDMFVEMLKGFQNNMLQFNQKLTKADVERVKQDILDNIVNARTLLTKAEMDKITVDQAKIDEQLAQIKGNFPKPEAYTKSLEAQGITEDFVKNEIGNSLKINQLVEKNVLSKINITDEQAKDYYDLHQTEFNQPERVRAAHILAKFESPQPTEDEKKKVRERIEKIEERIKNGEDFTKLATEENDDMLASKQGGDIGVFAKGQVDPAFGDAAFALEPDQVSDIVESAFGYHLIKVSEKLSAGILPFEDAVESVKANLKNKESQEKVKTYIDQLREEFKVKILL